MKKKEQQIAAMEKRWMTFAKMERLTDKNASYEMEFCEHCPYEGEPNGCNRAKGECEGYFKFTEFAERLSKLEDKLESGQLVEIPLKKQEYLYHLIKNRSKFGAVVWVKRKITWESYVINIVKRGDDGLYFATSEQAEARLKELREGI